MDNSFSIPDEISRKSTPVRAIQIELVKPPAQRLLLQDTNFTTQYQGDTREQDSQAIHIHSYAPPAEHKAKQVEFSYTQLASPTANSHLPYKRVLLATNDSITLISKFLQEPSRLMPSDAAGKGFSIEKCMGRMREGHTVELVHHLRHELQTVNVSASAQGLFWRHGKRRSYVTFKTLYGILFGKSSSGFRMSSRKGLLEKVEATAANCMTILGKFRSYDICCLSDTAKYDIYLVAAWYISSNSPNSSIIPLSKQKFTLYTIVKKLEKEAKQKHLFLKELFLLGIIKTLIERNESAEKVARVKRLLDNGMTCSSKIYRISYRLKPKDFYRTKVFEEKIENAIRVRELQGRMAYNLRDRKEELEATSRATRRGSTTGKNLMALTWNTVKSDLRQYTTIGSLKHFIDKGTMGKLVAGVNKSVYASPALS